jgi:hypothetical protein
VLGEKKLFAKLHEQLVQERKQRRSNWSKERVLVFMA